MKNKFYFEGKFYRQRSIGTVSNIYQKTLIIRSKLRVLWDAWWGDAFPLKNFWGYVDGEKILFDLDAESYSNKKADGPSDFILSSKFEDLALMIVQPGYKTKKGKLIQPDLTSCTSLMSEILQGKKNVYPERQDLVDRHRHLRIRMEHVWKATGLCLQFIQRHIKDEHSNRIPRPFSGENALMILTINGYKYHYYHNGQELKLIDKIENLNPDPNIIIS